MLKRKKIPLYLHIGLHKTGTTYLQSVLARNRAFLAENGVLFPEAGYGKGTATFKKRGLVSAGHAGFVRAAKDTDIAGPLLNQVRRGIRSNNINKVIISAENFDNPLARSRPGLVKKLFREYDVHVVVYLRRIDDWSESHYKQVMTAHHQQFFGKLPEIVDSKYSYALDYFSRIDRWSRRFGMDKVHVRVYEEARRGERGLLGDFLNVVNESHLISQLDIDVSSVNLSYGREIVEICRLFKEANHGNQKFVDHMREFVDELQHIDHIEDRMRILSPAHRRDMNVRWQGVAENLKNAAYLSDEQAHSLMANVSDDEDWEPLRSLPLELVEVLVRHSRPNAVIMDD